MITFETNLRVRYAETDQMGYVYYGNYATYFEVGRTDALRSLDTSYQKLEASGVMMPVVELKCKYIKPAKYDDLLTIKTIVEELPTTRMYFKYEVYNQQGILICIGETTLAFIDMKLNKPMTCPAWLTEKFELAMNQKNS